MDCLAHFHLDHEQATTLVTLFTQRMLERSYLAFSQFKPSLAHEAGDVDRYLDACGEVFGELRRALDAGDPAERLAGPPARQGFYRLT